MSTPTYTVIGAITTRAARPVWMLEELGLPYEHVGAKPHEEPVTRHYPSGKVPVLLVGDEAITDSTAIIQYLADKHGKFTHPAGTLERARQDGLTHCILDEFDAVLWTAARHSFILPEDKRVPEVKESLRWEFTRNQASFVKRMGQSPYLAGDELTVPDILLAHCMIWARAAKFDITEPVLADYMARIRQRPGFQRTFKR
ncbi:MAG: glutathione S-transferase family protein [Pararhodobacter sp.]